MASKTFQGAAKLSNSNLELNLDLHTRLCKKIAQLTKVHHLTDTFISTVINCISMAQFTNYTVIYKIHYI